MLNRNFRGRDGQGGGGLGRGQGGRGQGGGGLRRGQGGRGQGGGNKPGSGPAGNCVCPKCGHKEPHVVGQRCIDRTCPKCGTKMIRE
jgi:hypothetical protein